MNGAKFETGKQFWIMLGATLADIIWCSFLGVGLFLLLGSWSSWDGALGRDSGFWLTLAVACGGNLLWTPVAVRLSTPVIKKLAKRIGVTSGKEE